MFDLWSGKITLAAGPALWNLWATITDLARLEPVLHNKRRHHNEKAAHHKYDSEDPAEPKINK